MRPCRNHGVWDNKQLDYCGARSSGPWSWPWPAPSYRTLGLLRAAPLCTSGAPSRSCSTSWPPPPPPPFRFRFWFQFKFRMKSKLTTHWDDDEIIIEKIKKLRIQQWNRRGDWETLFFLHGILGSFEIGQNIIIIINVNYWSRFLFFEFESWRHVAIFYCKIKGMFATFSKPFLFVVWGLF